MEPGLVDGPDRQMGRMLVEVDMHQVYSPKFRLTGGTKPIFKRSTTREFHFRAQDASELANFENTTRDYILLNLKTQ